MDFPPSLLEKFTWIVTEKARDKKKYLHFTGLEFSDDKRIGTLTNRFCNVQRNLSSVRL
jgi:hypothetical protein